MSSLLQPLVSSRTGDTCYTYRHPSGLLVTVWPKPDFRTTYASLTVRYGSVYSDFVTADGQTVATPAGVAHYLEHKLFESDDGDAMERMAQIGASANAYTSPVCTSYLFSCTSREEEALTILLDFVQKPYFTDQTVEKERGIIAEEIRIGEDSPSRRSFRELLTCLYRRHPVAEEVAGTLSSIQKITPEVLYTCYNTFYHSQNMMLSVCGNLTPEQVAAVVEKNWKLPGRPLVSLPAFHEPAEVVTPKKVLTMDVACPVFCLGYKDAVGDDDRFPSAETAVAADIFLDILVGRGTPLYESMMGSGIINDGFGAEYIAGPGYGMWLFSGESFHPEEVADAIAGELRRLRREGLDEQRFTAARNALYGRCISGLNSVEDCAESLTGDWLGYRQPMSLPDTVAALTLPRLEELFTHWLTEGTQALCVINGKEETT